MEHILLRLPSATLNDGFYQLQIPEIQAIGTDYRVRIISLESSSVSGESNSDFAIAALPSLSDIPYSESFEAGLGNWIQSGDDDFNWTLDSGGTPSGATGPPAAQDGTFYIYTESSKPNYPYKSAWLENALDLRNASALMLSFYYHLYGSTTGTLAIKASVDQTHWTSLFSLSGDQGDSWHPANCDLSQFAGQVVLIRIAGTTGSSWYSDMALDTISIDEASKKMSCDT